MISAPRRRPFEVVVGGETLPFVLERNGDLVSLTELIGTVSPTKTSRSSRKYVAESVDGRTTTAGKTAVEAAVALVYRLLRRER